MDSDGRQNHRRPAHRHPASPVHPHPKLRLIARVDLQRPAPGSPWIRDVSGSGSLSHSSGRGHAEDDISPSHGNGESTYRDSCRALKNVRHDCGRDGR
jgi:hypothetical protein